MTVTASDYVFVSLLALKDKVLENMKDKKEEEEKKSFIRSTTKTIPQTQVLPPVSKPGIIIEEVKKPAGSMLDGIEEEEKKNPSIFKFDDDGNDGGRGSRRLSNAELRDQTAANIARKLSERK